MHGYSAGQQGKQEKITTKEIEVWNWNSGWEPTISWA